MIAHVSYFLPNYDHGSLSNPPTQRSHSSHAWTFSPLQSSIFEPVMLVLQPVHNTKIAITNSSMMDFDAGGNFVMITYNCISAYHFQRYCSG